MQARLSTIHQTLTPEAANVLNQSIADAGRRSHSQTTPLHVAATLLSSSNGFFRQACMQSHPNPSHPLQCRALELCFSVALERVPSGSATAAGIPEPPVSNALMAALKRAQAHQRKGCPEQQQQPLLAVKVELEQLVISILDDPSVSRVMREAGFSSPAVKGAIEQTVTNSQSPVASPITSAAGLSLQPVLPRNLYMNHRLQEAADRPTDGHKVEGVKNLYMNPRLQVATVPPTGGQRAEEAKHSCLNPQLQVTQDRPKGCQRASDGEKFRGNHRFQSSPEIPDGGHREEDVKKVVDVLQRSEKRNPVLVGDQEPEAAMKELLRRIERRELGEKLENVRVVSVDKELVTMCCGKGEDKKGAIGTKIKELGVLIESRMGNRDGVILNLGDLRCLVEQPGHVGFGVSPSGTVQEVIAGVAKLFVREDRRKVWLMGTATCETYLRCQVYHPSLENDWLLHAVPIAARSPLPGLFKRIGGNTIMGSTPRSLSPLKTSQLPNLLLPSERSAEKRSCFRPENELPFILHGESEKEPVKLAAVEREKSSSESKTEESTQKQQLPQWLLLAKAAMDSSPSKEKSEHLRRQKTEDLHKWKETCNGLHKGYNLIHDKASSPTYSPLLNSCFSVKGRLFDGDDCTTNPLMRPEFQPKIPPSRTNTLQLRTNASTNLSLSSEPSCLPSSPVTRELVLGHSKSTSPENPPNDSPPELPASKPDVDQCNPKPFYDLDADSFKSLFKGLAQKVSWQMDAARTISSVVTKCRSGDGKRKGGVGTRGDTWLLFVGPDRVGKRKMAEGLSELVFGNVPIYVRLGSGNGRDDDSGPRLWGKTVLDRISDAVRRNPFSIVVLEDVDLAYSVTQNNLTRAMERGRLPDSHGREVKLGNVIFVLTSEWIPDKLSSQNQESGRLKEDKLAAVSGFFRPLQLKVGARNKRRPVWLDESEECRAPSSRKPALAIDLNQSVDEVDLDSSDITVETTLKLPSWMSAMRRLADGVEEAIAFKAVNFEAISKRIVRSLEGKFSFNVGKATFEVEEEALEQLLAGIWFREGSGGLDELEGWAGRVLVPVFRDLESSFEVKENTVIRLSVVEGETDAGNWLPADVPVSRA